MNTNNENSVSAIAFKMEFPKFSDYLAKLGITKESDSFKEAKSTYQAFTDSYWSIVNASVVNGSARVSVSLVKRNGHKGRLTGEVKEGSELHKAAEAIRVEKNRTFLAVISNGESFKGKGFKDSEVIAMAKHHGTIPASYRVDGKITKETAAEWLADYEDGVASVYASGISEAGQAIAKAAKESEKNRTKMLKQGEGKGKGRKKAA